MSRRDDFLHIEEDFHSNDRKDSRKDRKSATKRDRSKYKKSDQDQLKKQADRLPTEYENLPRGRVLAIVPEGMIVDSNGEEFVCQLKGAMKHEKNRIKNLVAVGDFVRFEEKSKGEGTIARVEERTSILSRADNLSRNKEQLIAVNIDQVLITASVVTPPLKPPLIDRYIIAAQKGNMEPVILINKVDLLENPPHDMDIKIIEEQKALFEIFLEAYAELGITIIPLSIETNEGIDDLHEAMKGKTSVFSGQSGVGKSSLINLLTGRELKTGGMVHRTRKGSHTTTTTHLIPLDSGGFCIDTPGIKSFGLWDLKPEDLAAYYPELCTYGPQCKFPDCAHINEPDCAVKNAVEEGKISPLRFASYCALMTSLSEEHKNR